MAPELREIMAKLTEVQTRLDDLSLSIGDHERRIVELESLVAGFVIPRLRSPFTRSSGGEYVVKVEPAYGTPETLTIKARSKKEALEKAKARFPIPATPKIVATPKQETAEEIANPSRWVLEMYPLDVLAWRRSLIELAGKPLTPSEYRLVSDYDRYLRRKGYLTSRQIETLGEIARRHDVELPAIPERVT